MPTPPGAWSWVHDPVTFAFAALMTFVITVGYAILSGKLVPRRTVDDQRVDWRERLKEATDRESAWRDAFEVSDEARRNLAAQVDQLLILGRTTEALLRNLPNGTVK